jgi:hypothetical protein
MSLLLVVLLDHPVLLVSVVEVVVLVVALVLQV